MTAENQTSKPLPDASSASAASDIRPVAFDPLEIVTIRPATTAMTRQQLPNFVGVSAATAGARGISMNMVIIPPGGAAEPHLHRGYETAIYLL